MEDECERESIRRENLRKKKETRGRLVGYWKDRGVTPRYFTDAGRIDLFKFCLNLEARLESLEVLESVESEFLKLRLRTREGERCVEKTVAETSGRKKVKR